MASRDWSSDPRDVFALTKLYMHSTNLHAPPLLVLPTECRLRVQGREPAKMLPVKPLDPDRVNDLRAAAKFFSDPKHKLYDYYLPATSEYYNQLINAAVRRKLPSSAFLQSHTASGKLIQVTSNELFPHLPASGWSLKVRYKRNSNR